MDSLGIAIDGGRYIRVDSRIGDLPHNIRLRTIRDNQGSARLDFCTFRGEKPRIRFSHRITGLEGSEGRPSEIKLRAERRTFALWEVRINRSGSKSETVRIRTRTGLWPLIVLLILLITFGFWVFFSDWGSSFTRSILSPRVISAPEEAVSQTKPAPESRTQIETPAAEPVAESSPVYPADITADTKVDTTAISLPEPTVIYFAPESAWLNTRAKAEIETAAALIPENINLEIGGHCAEFGTERGQKALSLFRAQVVADYLKSRIPESVILDVRGYGVSNPVTRDPEEQNLNRRVVIHPVKVDE